MVYGAARKLAALSFLWFLIHPPESAEAARLDVEDSSGPGGEAGCGGSGCAVRLVLAECPLGGDVVIPNQDVNTGVSFMECGVLSAHDVDVLQGGRLLLRSRARVVLSDGFSVSSGGHLDAGTDSSLHRGDAFLEDASPSDESRYVARFYLNLDALSVSGSSQFDHLVGYGPEGEVQFRVSVKASTSAGTRRLSFGVRQDDGSFLTTDISQEISVSLGWHAVEVDWIAASGPGAGDGSMTVCLDDDGTRTSCTQIPGGALPAPENSSARIDSVRWGAQGIDPYTSGSIAMDEFVSRREGPIGL